MNESLFLLSKTITFKDEKKCDMCTVLAIALIYPRMNIKMTTYNAFMTMTLRSFRVRALSVQSSNYPRSIFKELKFEIIEVKKPRKSLSTLPLSFSPKSGTYNIVHYYYP